MPFHQGRNEQAMVHIASGYARQRNRRGTYACTTSVGPGATNRARAGHRVAAGWTERAASESASWGREVEQLVSAP